MNHNNKKKKKSSINIQDFFLSGNFRNDILKEKGKVLKLLQ